MALIPMIDALELSQLDLIMFLFCFSFFTPQLISLLIFSLSANLTSLSACCDSTLPVLMSRFLLVNCSGVASPVPFRGFNKMPFISCRIKRLSHSGLLVLQLRLQQSVTIS
jgi:hypothetical protein